MLVESLILASVGRNSQDWSKHPETGRNLIQSETMGILVPNYILVRETIPVKTKLNL